jgi:hypothetical protein
MTTQTMQEIEEIVKRFELVAPPGLLSTPENAAKVLAYVEKNLGSYVSVNNLLTAIEAIRPELSWFDPTPPAPAVISVEPPKPRGTRHDRLGDLGLTDASAGRMTAADLIAQDKEAERKTAESRTNIINRQRELAEKQTREAELTVTIYHETGPYSGRPDHTATAQARKAAKQKYKVT